MILLAERDPYAAEFAEYFLKTEGFQVVLALDAADAVGAVGGSTTARDHRPPHLGGRRDEPRRTSMPAASPS